MAKPTNKTPSTPAPETDFADALDYAIDAEEAAPEPAQPKAQALPPKAAPPAQRVFKNAAEVHHDLYKLKVASFMNNKSWNKNAPIWEPIEHTHHFHTVDSSGRPMSQSNKVGGHYHIMTVTQSPNGGPPTVTCSPAMVDVMKKGKNGPQKVSLPAIEDHHTHEVEYRGSEMVKVRSVNAEFTQLDASLKAKENITVPGIVG